MKQARCFTAIALSVCLLLICACGSRAGAAAVSLDYGESVLYSQEDMDAAIQLIQEEFAGWKGCELHSLRYTTDACNTQENIQWMNALAKGQDLDITFTQCIAFESDFHSPKNSKDQGTWNLDMEYTDWQWWLARTDGGAWHLMTWGY